MDATQTAMINEDWVKVAAWNVTTAGGDPVTTLDELAEVLDLDRSAAAQELVSNPASASAPAELLQEAQDELAPDPGQASLLDEFADTLTDGEGDAPPAAAAAAKPATSTDAPAKPDTPADTEDDEDEMFGPGSKAFPWQKDSDKDKGPDTGSSTRKQTIAAGAFVSWSGGRGKVEAVITNGKVPGVESDLTGTKDAPVAKVRVWKETDGSWKATDDRVAVKASSCKTIPPLDKGGFGKKSGVAGLVLLAAQQDPAVLPTELLRKVYDRGVRSWPGETKTVLSAEDWGLARAGAFVEKVTGIDTPGYVGDDDLLPE